MAIRFAPFAKIKIFSLASYLYRFIQNNQDYSYVDTRGNAQVRKVDARVIAKGFAEALLNSVVPNVDSFNIKTLNDLFDDVALATSISINESFNTKSVFNVGQPEDPLIIPGNMNVKVSISRLTTDSRQIADYVTKPAFYYTKGLQQIYSNKFKDLNEIVKDYNMFFYTYIFLDSLETESYTTSMGKLQNFQIVAFMPSSFSKRIESNTAEIVSDVEGEGKLFTVDKFIKNLSNSVRGLKL
jgi:hypothetical protein